MRGWRNPYSPLEKLFVSDLSHFFSKTSCRTAGLPSEDPYPDFSIHIFFEQNIARNSVNELDMRNYLGRTCAKTDEVSLGAASGLVFCNRAAQPNCRPCSISYGLSN